MSLWVLTKLQGVGEFAFWVIRVGQQYWPAFADTVAHRASIGAMSGDDVAIFKARIDKEAFVTINKFGTGQCAGIVHNLVC